ncbi:MAG TPA: DUF4296 domain-containing protein [Flavisolibacter sp.]|nr:DUF4296 domain-containing protein [Flavisolibacter sp.]
MRYLLIFIFFIASCSSNDVPNEVLPPEKMGAVWYDIAMADEFVDFASMSDSTFRKPSKRTGLYDTVFQLHKITKEQYKKSEKFYQSRPDLMKEIFEDLKKKIEKVDTPAKTIKRPVEALSMLFTPYF